jgi:integrase
MSENHFTPAATPGKPTKPRPDFPLFPHASGQWAKKIRGRMHYFGKDKDAALAKYLDQKDYLHSGRTVPEATDDLTIKKLANAFLNAKRQAMENGEIKECTWMHYRLSCEIMAATLDKHRQVVDLGPADFAALRNALAKRYGVYRLGLVIQHVRTLFKWGVDSELTPKPRYGANFNRPSKKAIRLHRAQQGPKLFAAVEIQQLLDAASPAMWAMILLGINCGFGNSDCGHLQWSNVDLERGWIDYPRPKTGIPRRCPLWPETIAALRAVLGPDASSVFVTDRGNLYGRERGDSRITHRFTRLMRHVGINGHRNFYTLRHTFRTVADETKDSVACDAIMGHETPHMSSVYRERISDERLRAVADHVHSWLFGTMTAGPRES